MAGNSSVIGALFYLRVRSLQNLALSRLRRLRQPKYMMGAVIGVAYFYWIFGRGFRANRAGRAGGPLDGMPEDWLPLVSIIGAVGLLVLIALCWVFRRPRAALGFSEAEIAFLFPAPISRSSMIHFRLISLGLTATFTALILALVSGRFPGFSDNVLVRIIGWWLIFATVSLHTVGSSFAMSRLQDRGVSVLNSQLLASGAVLLAIGLPVAWLWHVTPAGELPAISALQTGPVAWLLLPFRLLLAPLLAADWRAFLPAVGPAVLIYAAHYLWVLLVQVGFEEASIAQAEKRAARLAAMRTGNLRIAGTAQKARAAPFNLATSRRPELAFLWKNLLASAGYLRLRNALIAAAIIVVACTWFADSAVYQGVRPMLAGVVFMIAGYTVVLGPQLSRQDFRSDLLNVDILKTYPLRGWQIMLGEMLTPAAILTVLLWLMLLAGSMLLPTHSPRLAWLTPGIRTAMTSGLALLMPVLCLSQLLIVNAAAVLFPAWSQPGAGRPQQGIEVMGQRIFFLVGQMIAVFILLLPAATAAGLAFFLSRWIVGDAFAIGLGAVMVALIMGVEIAAGVRWLGRRFEQLDLSQELRP